MYNNKVNNITYYILSKNLKFRIMNHIIVTMLY